MLLYGSLCAKSVLTYNVCCFFCLILLIICVLSLQLNITSKRQSNNRNDEVKSHLIESSDTADRQHQTTKSDWINRRTSHGTNNAE